MAVENGKIPSGELKDTDKVVVDSFAALSPNDFDDTPTTGSNKLMTSGAIKEALSEASEPSDYQQVKAQVQQNTQDIAGIEDKIPAQASAQNQLADKAFVNSSIATNTATFRGSYNLVSDLGLTVSATQEQVAAAIATHLAALVPPVVPENNDYCFVQVPRETSDPTVIDRIDRYKCTVTESGGVTTRTWGYEWSLNNSSFTADQWAAINSGITSALVEKLGALPTAQELATALLAKYEKPSGGIPKTDLSAGVQASLDKADSALQSAPVTSVNNQTGAVVLSADNVNAIPRTAGYNMTEAGCTTDYLINPSLVGGIRMRYSSTNLSNYTAYAYLGVAVRRNGATTDYLFDNSQNGIARLVDIYTAIQQIAPDFTAKAYALNELCSYNGVVYRCKSAYTATAQSEKPPSDTTHWEAKKVSDLFLPLTGGTLYNGITFYNALGVDMSIGAIGGLFYIGNTLIGTSREGFVAYEKDLAPDYSTSATYAVNDLCVYSGRLYRCTTAITTAEAWTAAHWTEATVEDVLAAIRSALGDKAPLASPAFTGTPTAPTPTSGDNSTKVATTAFVKNAQDAKLDSTSAAPAFSTSSTYAVGDFCVYQGRLYQCTTAITASGSAWDSSKWSAPTLTDLIDEKADKIPTPTSGNLVTQDANGNLADAGYHFEVRDGIPCIVQYT